MSDITSTPVDTPSGEGSRAQDYSPSPASVAASASTSASTPRDFSSPPDITLSAAAELEYLTRTAFLAVANQPIPDWMNAHIAPNFRAEIDNLGSLCWADHVAKFQKIALVMPSTHRITNLTTEVDETKVHADVFCHMESVTAETRIKRQGMAMLKWKRHPRDGRWQLLRIIGMREPPADLGGDDTVPDDFPI